ncbi:MAG: zinc-binding dehydrogenase [Vampirovibrionales bacterium]
MLKHAQITHQNVQVVTYTPDATEAQRLPMPELPKGGAIIQTLGCGLCGTDAEKIQQQKVPVGSVLGHEVVGRIHQLDAEYHGDFAVDDRLVLAHHVPCGLCHYCVNGSPSMCADFKASNLFPGGFAPYFSASAGHLAHTAFKIPSHISDREAACMEPLACVLRAIRRTPLSSQNGSVAVIGLGFIGLLTAQVLSNQGQKVLGVDLNPQRLGLARTMEWVDEAVHPTEQASDWQAWLETCPTQAVDAVFLSVVNRHTLALAFQLLRNGGTLTLMAGNAQGEIMDPKDLYYREINIVTSYSPALEDLKQASNALFERQIVVNPLMTHPMPIEDFNEGLSLYSQSDAIKVFYQFPNHSL